MNNKSRTTSTHKDARSKAVPRLRFPEFRLAAAWENKLIGPYLEDCSGRAPSDTALPIFSSTREGLKRQDAYFDGRVLQNNNEYGVVPPGCFVYRHMSDDGLFKFNINETGGQIAVSKEYPVFKTRGIAPAFLLAKLNDGLDFKHFALSQKAGGTRTRLYFSRLCEWRTFLPSPAEQRKIAECLNSADELMAAQARKVNSLKSHKKRLMQELFPREGETQPRIRLPEFQNAEEWVVKPLGEIFPITSSKRVHESDWTPTGVPFYRAREIVALNKREPIQPLFISEDLYAAHSKQTGEIRDDHLLVTGVGSIGVPYLVRAGDRFYFKDGNIIWLKNDGKELSGEFLLRLYETEYVQKQLKAMADVGTVATYTIDNAKRTLAAYPKSKDEQQRIATCLSSLDALITAATQKLEALKAHKKGLMQQLLPSPEDVDA